LVIRRLIRNPARPLRWCFLLSFFGGRRPCSPAWIQQGTCRTAEWRFVEVELSPYPPGTAADHAVVDTPRISWFWPAGTTTTWAPLRWLRNQNPALALTTSTRLLIVADSLAVAGRAVFSRETKTW